MKKLFVLLSLAVAVIATTGCSDSDEKQTRKQAQNGVNEYNALAKEIQVTLEENGMPDSSWSTEDLTALRDKFSRLLVLEAELASLNGKAGITIRSPGKRDENRARLMVMQMYLDQLIEQKAQGLTDGKVKIAVPDIDLNEEAQVESYSL